MHKPGPTWLRKFKNFWDYSSSLLGVAHQVNDQLGMYVILGFGYEYLYAKKPYP